MTHINYIDIHLWKLIGFGALLQVDRSLERNEHLCWIISLRLKNVRVEDVPYGKWQIIATTKKQLYNDNGFLILTFFFQ